MDRTAKLIAELPHFNIELQPIQFGKSGSDYTMDKENNVIYKGIASIKYCNSQIAEELLKLSHNRYTRFIDLLKDINEYTSLTSQQLKILIGLNFFSQFGNNKKLLQINDVYNGIKVKTKTILPSFATCKQIKKDKIESYREYGITEFLIKKHSAKETAKQYSQIDNEGLLVDICNNSPNKPMSVVEQVKFELEYLEYTTYTNSDISDKYYIVVGYKTYRDVTKPYVTLRCLNNGEEIKTKITKGSVFRLNPFNLYSILHINELTPRYKSKNIDGEWIQTDEKELVLEEYEVIKNV